MTSEKSNVALSFLIPFFSPPWFLQGGQEPPHKKSKSDTSTETGVLCAAVNGDYVAVGYSGDGFKLFRLSSGGFHVPEHRQRGQKI